MKLNPTRFGFSAATAMCVCHLGHGLLLYLFPLPTLQISAHNFYLKSLALLYPYVRVSPLIIASSLIQIFMATFFVFWFMAIIYNLGTSQD